ncbi:MAG: rhodanese-like domain-containing protein, partial [Campylobacterota bacterium]
IPDTKFDEYYKQIASMDKKKEVIVFCGGWKCTKSPEAASMLVKKGFTNVKLYQAGEPEWKKKTYSEVDTAVVRSAQKKNNAVIIDARPYKKYLQATIPGAIAIPDTDMNQLLGKLPADKKIKVITFCGGYHCGKSHKVAKKMLSMGYKNVVVYAGGLPKWKKDGMATTGSSGKKVATKKATKEPMMANGIKQGVDEGTVDGMWFKKMIETNKVPKNVQIVDVFSPEEFRNGHLPNAINVHAESLNAKELLSKLPKNKVVVFNCVSGAQALEARTKLKKAKLDVSKIYYFDANIICEKDKKCIIEVNEPLG